MFQELWLTLRGRAAAVPTPDHLTVRLPDEDEPECRADLIEAPNYEGQAIGGFACIIRYCDGRGQESERRISCLRLDRAGGLLYLMAYCHERRARRQFRIDRITTVADLLTGETSDDAAEFFARFEIGREQSTRPGWGLNVRKRADLIAGLNTLVFLGRCDKEWHPLERDTVERFVASWWLQAEIDGDPPLDDIIAHTDRLSPDAETFYVSLMRCHDNALLARIIRRHMQAVIEADGRVHEQEFYWGNAVDDYFRQLSAAGPCAS